MRGRGGGEGARKGEGKSEEEGPTAGRHYGSHGGSRQKDTARPCGKINGTITSLAEIEGVGCCMLNAALCCVQSPGMNNEQVCGGGCSTGSGRTTFLLVISVLFVYFFIQ